MMTPGHAYGCCCTSCAGGGPCLGDVSPESWQAIAQSITALSQVGTAALQRDTKKKKKKKKAAAPEFQVSTPVPAPETPNYTPIAVGAVVLVAGIAWYASSRKKR